MATNPMQRKARNSFLLGMLVMLLISGMIIGLLFMQLMNKMKKEQEDKANSVTAYVLNQDVKAGQTVTDDMLTKQTVNKALVPTNATSNLSVINNYALKDKEGNAVTTEYRNSNGETTAAMYITLDNTKFEVKKEDESDSYYITKNGQKEYLDLVTAPLIAKVNMKKNTLITTDLLSQGTVKNDIREQEYNVVVMPMDLVTGDYIDIRLMLPNGQDFIVVAKKEVTIPNVGGTDSADTLKVKLSEDETLHMSSAIIDAASMNGAKIYATKYTDAGIQEASTPNYVVRDAVSKELQADPNILSGAMETLRARYNAIDTGTMNTYRENALNSQGDQAQTNLETNMSESITNSKTTRKDYLEGLSGGTTSSSDTSSSSSSSSSSK